VSPSHPPCTRWGCSRLGDAPKNDHPVGAGASGHSAEDFGCGSPGIVPPRMRGNSSCPSAFRGDKSREEVVDFPDACVRGIGVPASWQHPRPCSHGPPPLKMRHIVVSRVEPTSPSRQSILMVIPRLCERFMYQSTRLAGGTSCWSAGLRSSVIDCVGHVDAQTPQPMHRSG